MNFLDGRMYLLSIPFSHLPFMYLLKATRNFYGFMDQRNLLMEILKNTQAVKCTTTL